MSKKNKKNKNKKHKPVVYNIPETLATKAGYKKSGNFVGVLIKWLAALVFVHGWWKNNPDFVWYKINIKKGHPIHEVTCKACGEKWFTSCPLHVCNRIRCWSKYAKMYGGI